MWLSQSLPPHPAHASWGNDLWKRFLKTCANLFTLYSWYLTMQLIVLCVCVCGSKNYGSWTAKPQGYLIIILSIRNDCPKCIDISAKASRQCVLWVEIIQQAWPLSLPISNCLSADGAMEQDGSIYYFSSWDYATYETVKKKRRSSSIDNRFDAMMLMMMGGWSVSGPYTLYHFNYARSSPALVLLDAG